jgi:hypothetical protein
MKNLNNARGRRGMTETVSIQLSLGCFQRGLTLSVTAALLCVLAAGCNPSNEPAQPKATHGAGAAKPKTAFTPEGTIVTVEEKITVPANAGPAARLVESFFQNWKAKRFEAMHEQMIGTEAFDEFRDALVRTPVRWNSVEILEETAEGDSKRVSLSIEVTDLPSVMGAYLFNYAANSPVRGEVSSENPFPAKPGRLGIETFRKIKQTWRIVAMNNAYKIDLGKDPKDNILHYFIDAGSLAFSSSDGSPMMFKLHMARLIVLLSEPLGMSTEEANKAIPEMSARAERAAACFRGTSR